MDELDEIQAREPTNKFLSASEVKNWLGISDYLFWESVKAGQIKKVKWIGKYAKYNKLHIKTDLGLE